MFKNRPAICVAVSIIFGCANTEPNVVDLTDASDANISGCALGAIRCVDGLEEVCNELGLWTRTSERGSCAVDLCANARRTRSYIGCEYWPVDLDNAIEILADKPNGARCSHPQYNYTDQIRVCDGPRQLGGLCDVGDVCPPGYQCRDRSACILNAQRSPFSIVVSNPSDSLAANLVLTDAEGNSTNLSVQPNAVEKIYPDRLGLADMSVDHTSLSRRAYQLLSDAPIVAYQFNPLDNVGVFSNDGSLLIPSHALDTIYYALTLPTMTRRPSKNDYSGYISIVGTASNETRIRVTPTGDIRGGIGIVAITAGTTTEFTLGQGDVLNLEAAAGADLTGTRIESVDGQTPFAVYVGHEAVIVTDLDPRRAPCCADHLEEQLFPASTWGSRFIIARTQPRPDSLRNGRAAPDLIRILAQKDDTEITFEPAVTGLCPSLNQGEFCDIFIDGDTAIDSSKPILVGHILLSTGGQSGDPGLAFAAPYEQFRERYTFLVPDEYQQQYISVAAWGDRDVRIDGELISDRLTAVTGNWTAGRIRVGPGQHELTCPDKCSVLVHGYSPAVSYLFAGGLDLAAITLP
ncbi:MAG: IgGFc-binding protein [Myxococcota bacterium]|nr:IgGFc-binding protein [Myxococcota bacterium]